MNAASSSKAGAPTGSKALRRSVARLDAHLGALERSRRRRRLVAAVGGPVLSGVVLAVALLVAGRYVRALHHPVVVVVTLAACAGVVVARAWGRRRSPFDVALWVDQRADLDERVSSALAFLDDAAPTPMMREAVSDAEKKLAAVDREQVSGRTPSRRWLIVPALLLLLPPLAMMPRKLTAGELATRRTQDSIQAAGQGLVAAADGAAGQMHPQGSPDASAAVDEARAAGAALAGGDLPSREDALERVQQARQQVGQTLRQDSTRQLLGDRLRQNVTTRTAGAALAQGQPQVAADALRDAADGLRPEDLDGSGGQELADDLRDAAQAVPPGEAQAALNRAAAGAEAGRVDAARDGLRALADQAAGMTALGPDREQVEAVAQALREARDQVGGAEPAGGPAPAGGAPGAGPPLAGRPAGEHSGMGVAPGAAGVAGAPPSPQVAVPDATGPVDTQPFAFEPGTRVEVAGQLLAGARQETGGSGRGPRVDESFAPDLRTTVRQFRDAGEAAIARQDIPPGYRTLVRDYFAVLEAVAGEDASGAARSAE